jgi:hypothetical protein
MAMYKAPGAPLKDVVWTLSQRDAIATVDAPSDAATAALGLVGEWRQRTHRMTWVCSRAETHRSSTGSASRGRRRTRGTAHDAPWVVRVVVPGGVCGGA